MFTVGEYWSADVSKLHRYITETDGEMSLFDVPLHYHLEAASKDENYDLSKLFDGTLVKENPLKAGNFLWIIMILSQGQSLQSFVERWFKPAAI